MIVSTPVEAALIKRITLPARVRCGTWPVNHTISCQVIRKNKTIFYTAVKWKSDGKWHFTKFGEVV